MASSRMSPTKRSNNPKTIGDFSERKRSAALPGTPARARRDDTPEARMQRRRAPKTHPNTRTPGAQRKDRKGAMGTTDQPGRTR
jgi:hypothetical protein